MLGAGEFPLGEPPPWPCDPESQSQTDGQGGTNSDIIIIGGTEQGVTQDGVPYTGQDLQNIVIQ